MKLPDLADLDAVTSVLVGQPTRYIELGIEQRTIVLDLAIKANACDMLEDIANNLDAVEQWFRHSKLWDGF